jgi:DNA-binding transcriptional ArsR family regulator
MSAVTTVEVIRDAERAAALLDPMRLRLVEQLVEPGTAASLARQLGFPRQRVNYHLRELEKQGFLQLVEERKKGNCMERVVRATARSFLISPEALGAMAVDPERIPDRFSSAFLVAVTADAIRDLAVLRARADKANQKLPTFTLRVDVRFATAAARKEFTEELATAVAKLAAKHHDEKASGGRLFRFLVGAYPVITKKE